MSEHTSVAPLDLLFNLSAVLREHGFDAAERLAAAYVSEGMSPQIQADLHASAGRVDPAHYDGSPVSAGDPADLGTRSVRVALFADALGNQAEVAAWSERAVAQLSQETALSWVVWMIERAGARQAAVHLLRAYQQRYPDDARAPWLLAQALDAELALDARNERRAALIHAYTLDPTFHPTLPLLLALALREVRDWQNVARVAQDALARDRTDAEMAWQLSHAQWQCGDARAAEATMRGIEAATPGHSVVAAAIGVYLAEQGRYAESEAALHEALARDSGIVLPSVDLAELELRRGDWATGWARYEARLAREDRGADNVIRVVERQCPRWRGESLAGKTLVVHSEQGNGDDIQMVRFLPQLAARVRDGGGRVVLACRRELQRLLGRLYEPCIALEDGLPDAIDYALPMMSLPFVLGVQPEMVHGAPYLQADPREVDQWRERLRLAIERRAGDPEALQVGLVWSGNAEHRRNAQRSVPIASLVPLRSLDHVVFHVLTPGRSDESEWLAAQGLRLCDLTAHYRHGFNDVAAYASALDAIVTIDSAPLHLGGALGRPVLAMLDHVSQWSWGFAESQSWYDSVELVRQPVPGAWAPVVERVVARLASVTTMAAVG